MKQTIIIVGGGITGLTAAYRLQSFKKENNLPLEIILLEASNRLGGVISSQAVDDYVIEHGPDAFLADRPEIKTLLADLNLDSQLLPTTKTHRRAFVAQHRKLMPLPSGFYLISPTNFRSLLKTKLFSPAAKLRIALEPLLPAYRDNTSDESAGAFIARRFGSELLARAGEPLIGGIYMADINQLSAQSTLPYFMTLEQNHGSVIRGLKKEQNPDTSTASGARYSLFSSFPNGMATLINRLKEELSDTKIFLNAKLQSLSVGEKKQWSLETEDGQCFDGDAVILSMPAKLTAPFISNLDKKLALKLKAIDTVSSVVVNLLYHRHDIGHRLDGFGFVVPATEKQKMIACGWISRKFSQRTPRRHEVIRVFLGGSKNPSLCELPEEELIRLAHSELAPYLQIKAPPARTWLERWPNGLPFYKIGHAKNVELIENYAAAHPGLFFAGASYNGLGIPDCVRSAETTVTKVANFLELTLNSSKIFAS